MTKSSFDIPFPCLPAQSTARQPTMQTPLQPGPKVIFCVRGATSPLLANVYLHYVLDLWVEQWRTRHARGDMIVVRYADDTIVGFQHRQDAERFLSDLKERLAKFVLSLHPEKTRLLEFGRYAAERRAERGQGKPEPSDFPGLTRYCTTRKDGT